ncbi:hypothetical protein WMY93_002991 [Mugilogobius chulae]|uniref:Uncharacterized protein n=1 Tax=Mugilogobius chulae TaxID=88201 RepID=A0AAW0Q3N4_9GOBI
MGRAIFHISSTGLPLLKHKMDNRTRRLCSLIFCPNKQTGQPCLTLGRAEAVWRAVLSEDSMFIRPWERPVSAGFLSMNYEA